MYVDRRNEAGHALGKSILFILSDPRRFPVAFLKFTAFAMFERAINLKPNDPPSNYLPTAIAFC